MLESKDNVKAWRSRHRELRGRDVVFKSALQSVNDHVPMLHYCMLLLHFPAQVQRASTLVTQSQVNHHLRMGTLFVLIRDGNYYRLTLITNVLSVCS